MRDLFGAARITIGRWVASWPKWAAETARHRLAHWVLALTHGALGCTMLLEAQWLHAACVLIAAAAYHVLSRH